MNVLYHPTVNRIVRHSLLPFASLLPSKARIPVTGEISVELGAGRSIRIRCNPTSFTAKVLFWGGVRGFEYDVIRIFLPIAEQSRVFFDVGSNIGYYSLVAAAVNSDLEIVAFEPLPAAHRYLEKNVRLNGFSNIRTERVALSDREGTTEFFAARNPKFEEIEDHLTCTGSLVEEQARLTPIVDSFSVSLSTLDRYVEENAIERIDLMKLDTEATEDLVLKGGQRVLAEHRPLLLCEVLPGRIEAEVGRILRESGYLLHRVEKDGLVRVEDLSHSRSTTKDHLMVHAEEEHRIAPYLSPSSVTS